MESLYKGMDVAKSQHVAIGKEVHTCLDMGHVINAGSCLYAVIQDVRAFGSNSMNRFRISIDFVIFAGHAGCEILRPSSQFITFRSVPFESSYISCQRTGIESQRATSNYICSFRSSTKSMPFTGITTCSCRYA